MRDTESDRREVDRSKIRVGWLSVGVGIAAASLKFGGFALSGSTALLSDALESLVNVSAAALLVWSLTLSARPADESHPYGHGKVEFFSAGIEGTLIFVAAIAIAWYATLDLIRGPVLRDLDIGLAALAAAGALNLWLGLHLIRSGRASGSLALEADGRHLLTDVWTSVGIFLGLGCVRLTGWSWLDPVTALVVACLILREGWSLMRRASEGLMDAADEPSLAHIAETLSDDRHDAWIDMHGLRAWRSGSKTHADCHLVVPRYFDADQLHAIHDEIDRRLHRAEPTAIDIVVHFDPCRPHHCSMCRVRVCPVRQREFVDGIDLTVERATRPEPVAEGRHPT